jgi:hypothetical protein
LFADAKGRRALVSSFWCLSISPQLHDSNIKLQAAEVAKSTYRIRKLLLVA